MFTIDTHRTTIRRAISVLDSEGYPGSSIVSQRRINPSPKISVRQPAVRRPKQPLKKPVLDLQETPPLPPKQAPEQALGKKQRSIPQRHFGQRAQQSSETTNDVSRPGFLRLDDVRSYTSRRFQPPAATLLRNAVRSATASSYDVHRGPAACEYPSHHPAYHACPPQCDRYRCHRCWRCRPCR